MKAPVAALKAARESRPGGRINLQESQSTTAATRQIRLLHTIKNLQQVRGLGVLHGRLGSETPPSDCLPSPRLAALARHLTASHCAAEEEPCGCAAPDPR